MHVYYDNALIYDSGLVSLHQSCLHPLRPGRLHQSRDHHERREQQRYQYALGVHRHGRLPGPGLRGVHREHQPGSGPHQVCLAAVPARRHEPGPLLPARTIAQHPRRRERLRHLATGNVGHSRRGRRSRAGTGQLAIALRLPEHRPRAHWLDARHHWDQHHPARPGRPLLRRCARLGNPGHQHSGLCLRAREPALQPDRAAHGHQRRRCHAAAGFDRRIPCLKHQRNAARWFPARVTTSGSRTRERPV